MLNICDLNLDCLLRIFDFCNEADLANLSLSSPFFYTVINNHVYYPRTLDLLICGHRNSPEIGDRTLNRLTYMNRYSIATNWVEGRYKENVYFHSRRWNPAKLHLERENLYLTRQCYIRVHKRLRDEAILRHFTKEIATTSPADIADFVKNDGTIFAGRAYTDGFIYEDNFLTEVKLHNPDEFISCVNFSNNLYLTSTDKCTRLWNRADQFGLLHLDLVEQYKETYKTFKFTPDGHKFYGGLYNGEYALREVDLETGTHEILNSNTTSVSELRIKDINVIFTANFDRSFRIYDRRAGCDVSIWDDQFSSSMYSMEYDGLHAVLCGVRHHSRVNLFDIRVPKKCIQMYFPGSDCGDNSPVYSLACDCRYLFMATGRNLKVLDFKADWASTKSYKHLFNNMNGEP